MPKYQTVSRTSSRSEAIAVRNIRLSLGQPVCLGVSFCVNWPVLGTHLCSRCTLITAVSRAATRYGTSMAVAASGAVGRIR